MNEEETTSKPPSFCLEKNHRGLYTHKRQVSAPHSRRTSLEEEDMVSGFWDLLRSKCLDLYEPNKHEKGEVRVEMARNQKKTGENKCRNDVTKERESHRRKL